MDAWRDIRALLEADDLPDPDEVLALLTAGDRQHAGPSWFARALARARPAWMADGLCAEHPAASWFPGKGQPTAPAKEICGRCLVRSECLAFAVAHDERGIWGGTSDGERRAIREARQAGEAA